MKPLDITNRKFGYLTARWVEGRSKRGRIWLFSCECGKLCHTSVSSVITKETRSCGCHQYDGIRVSALTHGQTRRGKQTPTYQMWAAAKKRAKDKGLSFSIELSDIIIPEKCPLLEIPLISNKGKSGRLSSNSPSLDRVIPQLGYVKGNIQVISYKANTMKNNATLEEFELMAKNWRCRLNNDTIKESA